MLADKREGFLSVQTRCGLSVWLDPWRIAAASSSMPIGAHKSGKCGPPFGGCASHPCPHRDVF
jgi:hypothetical protein